MCLWAHNPVVCKSFVASVKEIRWSGSLLRGNMPLDMGNEESVSKQKERIAMGIIPYALMAYGLAIVISLLVVAIIVITNKVLSKPGKEDEDNG